MKTVLIEVAEPAAAMKRIKATLRSGKPDKYARITFRTPESLARTLTPLRWTLLEAMTGVGEIGVRELARRLGRDVKAVHADVSALVLAEVVDRTIDGKYVFPYDRVKVQFELTRAA
ncbi:MAG: DNA-binding protein [Nevskiaceae bacterium]|nr:MAG: DNA-binding protein [Nevskiaceae bacterium]TBR74647.1 MAG: DNA-binding protein [Nevskiaceae bacterium]